MVLYIAAGSRVTSRGYEEHEFLPSLFAKARIVFFAATFCRRVKG
jgi:hypothetical protein